MKAIISVLLASSLCAPALGFQVINQTSSCVQVKDYAHIFNRYNEHIAATTNGFCDPSLPRCTDQMDFRVIKHSDGGEIQMEEPLCTWEGNIGKGSGSFVITTQSNSTPGEKDGCKIKYRPAH